MAPKIGERWQHFQGAVYEVRGFATDTEAEKILILYGVDDGLNDVKLWARPLENFLETLPKGNAALSFLRTGLRRGRLCFF